METPFHLVLTPNHLNLEGFMRVVLSNVIKPASDQQNITHQRFVPLLCKARGTIQNLSQKIASM